MKLKARSPLRLRLETVLECPADVAWDAERRVCHLLSVARPLIVLVPIDPAVAESDWILGQITEFKSFLFGMVPLGRLRVAVVGLSPETRELRTEESGGAIRRWDHRVKVDSLAPGRCRYQDEIEIEAGCLTRPLWLVAWLVYGLRQRRRRALARDLAGRSSPSPTEM